VYLWKVLWCSTLACCAASTTTPAEVAPMHRMDAHRIPPPPDSHPPSRETSPSAPCDPLEVLLPEWDPSPLRVPPGTPGTAEVDTVSVSVSAVAAVVAGPGVPAARRALCSRLLGGALLA